MERRKLTRVPVTCPIAFSGDQIVGIGQITDLSPGGARIASKSLPPRGTYLGLSIYVPDQESPLKVELAPVRWAQGGHFGVEFIRVAEDDQQRIRQLIRSAEASPTI